MKKANRKLLNGLRDLYVHVDAAKTLAFPTDRKFNIIYAPKLSNMCVYVRTYIDTARNYNNKVFFFCPCT